MGQHPFDISYVFEYFVRLLPSLRITLYIVGSSILLGLIVGLLVALPQLYRVPVLQRLARIYLSFFRGTPILIQLFLFYYGMPELLKLIHIDISKTSTLFFVILTYSLHSGAYISEVIRGAVTAVDRGQVEAAYAMGMNGYQAFVRIVMTQALAISIPVFANVVLGNLKDTSLAFSLGILEITGKAQTIGTLSQRFAEIYLSLAFLYFIICFVLERLFFRLERRLLRHEHSADAEQRLRRMEGSFFGRMSSAAKLRNKEARL
ncbi:amino acid ABC transporter permease [Paenibacillus sp. 1011MAR3C5]|uniref:amino acid ABC transporter permease n=1 Tax=Paenibacillus sp. 1011MAR3C5 TaxID=1675787 RepID=UPI000E6C67F9|nr:amino acid ABC transporter permease [Paenibacillus sp. 1011MAR3C5]RJE90353.1 amino acid ABC transporter permease [Paenibacillus sp. 1011MAR3C5]